MYSFEWKEQHGIFSAPVSGGRAIIVEHRLRGYGVPVGGGWKYDARIEFADGRIFDAVPDWSTFEDAEDWCRAVLPGFYRAQKKKRDPDPLESALMVCQQRFPSSLPAVYHLRLQALLDWVRGQSPTTTMADASLLADPHLSPWSRVATHWIAHTNHGQAEIWEAETHQEPGILGKRAEPRYHAKIKHPSGAELQSYETFPEWEDADRWVRQKLSQLEQPHVEEAFLDSLIFSVEIYQHLLASTVESEILVLLDDLKTKLGETLP